MASDTPRPKPSTCRVKGIFADMMVVCAQLLRIHDFSLAKMFSSKGDVFYIIDSTKEIDGLLMSDDVEELALSVNGGTTATFPTEVARALSTSLGNIAVAFVGAKRVEIFSPSDGGGYTNIYLVGPVVTETINAETGDLEPTDVAVKAEVPLGGDGMIMTTTTEHLLAPAMLVDFSNFNKTFLDQLPQMNVKLYDSMCRIFYSEFCDKESLPENFAENFDDFCIRHSNAIKILIEEQRADIQCGDALKRRQRRCKIERLAKLMITVHNSLFALNELTNQLAELLEQLPPAPACDKEDGEMSSFDESTSSEEDENKSVKSIDS